MTVWGISKSNIIITALLGLLVIYTSWLLRQTEKTAIITSQNDTLPDFIAQNILAIETGETGQVHNKFFAPKIVHYAKNDRAVYTKPHIISYPVTGKEPWDIKANAGESEHGTNKIILTDNVRIHEPAGKLNSDTWITTSKLVIYPKENYAETDQPVTFTEPGIVVKSVGMRVYFKEKRVELLNKAQGVYDAEQAKHNVLQ